MVESAFSRLQFFGRRPSIFRGFVKAVRTATAITLKNAIAEERTISRNDIKSLKALNMSAMTAGIDKAIDQQQMADLLAFLKKNR